MTHHYEMEHRVMNHGLVSILTPCMLIGRRVYNIKTERNTNRIVFRKMRILVLLSTISVSTACFWQKPEIKEPARTPYKPPRAMQKPAPSPKSKWNGPHKGNTNRRFGLVNILPNI